jgi:hypothetical protein
MIRVLSREEELEVEADALELWLREIYEEAMSGDGTREERFATLMEELRHYLDGEECE